MKQSEFKAGDKVYIYDDEIIFKVSRIQEKTGNIELETEDGSKFGWVDKKFLIHYNPKELKLDEILKGHEGETFFSYSQGDVFLSKVGIDRLEFWAGKGEEFLVYIMLDGRKFRSGEVDIFPSRELFKKYPLNPQKAWKEWEKNKLIKEIKSYSKSCVLEDDMDDRSYSIAYSSVLKGLELSLKYSKEEINKILCSQ